jgi:hypothetical protein
MARGSECRRLQAYAEARGSGRTRVRPTRVTERAYAVHGMGGRTRITERADAGHGTEQADAGHGAGGRAGNGTGGRTRVTERAPPGARASLWIMPGTAGTMGVKRVGCRRCGRRPARSRAGRATRRWHRLRGRGRGSGCRGYGPTRGTQRRGSRYRTGQGTAAHPDLADRAYAGRGVAGAGMTGHGTARVTESARGTNHAVYAGSRGRAGRSASIRWPRAGGCATGGVRKRKPRPKGRGVGVVRCSPDRIRTGATALRGRRPRPLDDGARLILLVDPCCWSIHVACRPMLRAIDVVYPWICTRAIS